MTCLAITSFDALPGLFCNYHTLSNDFAGIYRSTKGKLVQHRQGYSSSGDQLLQVPHIHPYPSDVLSSQRWNALMDIYFFYTFSNHLEAYGGKFNGNFRLSMVCHNMRNHGQRLCIVLQRLRPHANLPHDCLLALFVTLPESQQNAKINLMGIVPIKAYYLPLGNILIKLILRGPSGLVDTIIEFYRGTSTSASS